MILFSYDTLENYFNNNLILKLEHNFSIPEIEGLPAWEKAVYIELIGQKTRNEEEIRRLHMQQQENRGRV